MERGKRGKYCQILARAHSILHYIKKGPSPFEGKRKNVELIWGQEKKAFACFLKGEKGLVIVK